MCVSGGAPLNMSTGSGQATATCAGGAHFPTRCPSGWDNRTGCYSFSVKPKKLTPGKRYFEGQIWVDDRDLQIVKTYGKGVGELKSGSAKHQAFPKFETYREQIDGKYWFPTYTHADDVLHFPNGDNVHIRMTVKYQDYKKYEGKSTIRYGDVVDDKTPPPPTKKQ